MEKKNNISSEAAELRRKAEERLKKISKKAILPKTNEELLRLLHELQTHQIELEIINEELEDSREDVVEGLQQYTDLYDFAPTGYFSLKRDGTVCRANLTGSSMLGVDRSKLMNSRFGLFISEETRPAFNELLQKVFESKIKTSCEVSLLKEGNELFFVHIDATAGIDGQECKMTMVDITERKHSEEALLKLQKAIDNSGEVIFLTDKEGIFTFANPAFTSIFGFTAYEIVGKLTPRILKSGTIEANNYKLFWETIKSGKEVRGEIINKRKDGKLINVESSATPIFDEKKNIIGFLGIQRDITERKQAEEAIKESEERFRMLINSTSDMVFLKDDQFKHIIANIPLADFYGNNPDEIIGLTDFDLSPEDFSKQCHQSDLEALNTNSIIITEEASGDRYFETTKYPVKLRNNKVGIGGIIRDITERKRAEEEIRNLAKFPSENPSPILRIARDGTLLFVNESGVSLLADWHLQVGKEVPPVLQEAVFQSMHNITTQVLDLEYGERVYSFYVAPIVAADYANLYGRDITKRKRAEDALKESEESYRKLFENHSAVKIILDPDTGAILDANDAAAQYYGWTREEIKHMKIYQINTLSPEETNVEMEKVRFERQTHFEFRHRRADGSIRDVEVFSSKIEIKGKDVLDSIIHDITERKRAGEALQRSEADLKEAQRVGQIGSWDWDTTTDTIIWSEEYYRIFGFDPTQPPPGYEKYLKLYTPESAARLDAAVKESMQTGEEYQLELEHAHLNGTNHWITVISEVKRDDKGQIVGMRGTAQDITERKKSEKEISMLAHSIKSVNECISISDMEEKFIFVNESFLKTYGYEENELIGKHVSIVRSQNNPMELVEEILPATLHGEWKGELWNKRKDGSEFLISLSTSVINEKDGKFLGLVGLAIEITEQKRFEQELIAAKEKAESSSKLKDAFIANISHEIRTPLNGILGMASLIRDIFPGKLKKEDEELFAGVDFSSHRLIRTVDLILNYSRLQVGEFPIFRKNLSISSICQNLIKEVAIEAKIKLLDLTFVNNCPESEVFADEYSITMAISNLLSNALKYTDKGFINLILRKDNNDDIILDVKDTGIGISEVYLDKIYEPFRQEQMGYGRTYEGVGLGLALVNKILLLNNFRVSVESKKGVGTTFSINFGKGVNLNEIKVETGKTAVIPSVAKKPERAMVLIVEDDAINQFTMQLFLKNRYNSMVANSAENAMKILKNNKVDLILMDISIKGDKNGLELTKELKASKEYSHIPVIVCTGHVFVEDRQKASASGCDDFLAKPFSKQEVLDMLDSFAHK